MDTDLDAKLLQADSLEKTALTLVRWKIEDKVEVYCCLLLQADCLQEHSTGTASCVQNKCFVGPFTREYKWEKKKLPTNFNILLNKVHNY